MVQHTRLARWIPLGAVVLMLGVQLSRAAVTAGAESNEASSPLVDSKPDDPYVVVLGIAQDAGYPQAGCFKECCQPAWRDTRRRRFATALAIVDPRTSERWLVECTPQFPDQLNLLNQLAPTERQPGIDGVLLTHAHIGHYAGLVHFGKEVMGARDLPVYVMPRMREFLIANGPWSQLVQHGNIQLRPLFDGTAISLNDRISVTPLVVPHRDEFSETVAFQIKGPRRSILFLPDIDKWERWETDIERVIASVDVAYLDGTFFEAAELPGRDLSKIPHPLIQESLKRFARLPESERKKIRFIHLNHSNRALHDDSEAAQAIRRNAHAVAQQGERVDL